MTRLQASLVHYSQLGIIDLGSCRIHVYIGRESLQDSVIAPC